MKILIANDHAGLHLKEHLVHYLSSKEINVEDLGAYTEDSVDYPDYAKILISKMNEDATYIGILICGSGIGMSIAANRMSHIRAALCHTPEYAELARAHNDANVLVLGARFISPEEAINILERFLSTKFEAGRHISRINKLHT